MANTYSAVTTGFNVLDPANLDGTPIFSADATGIYSNGVIVESNTSAASITAHAGGGQGSATPVTASFNLVTVCATNYDSVVLPVITGAGYSVTIKNIGAAILSVFPNGTNTINGLGASNSIDIPALGGELTFTASSVTAWRTAIVLTAPSITSQTGDLIIKATASAGNFQTTITNASQAAARTYTIPDAGTNANFLMSQGAQTVAGTQTFTGTLLLPATNAITAFAGGGQGSATVLTSMLNRITVCATAGDSVKLPAATVGLFITVTNSGAQYSNVFPGTGDAIDALAINTAISCPVGYRLTFTCSVAGTWVAGGMAVIPASFVSGTTTTTFTAGQLTGSANVVYANTGATPGSIATRTATQMFTDNPYARVGGTYLLTIVNAQGTGTLTVTAGSSVTLTGTATIAANTSRTFVVTYNSATTLTIQNAYTATFS